MSIYINISDGSQLHCTVYISIHDPRCAAVSEVAYHRWAWDMRHPGLKLNMPPQLFCMSWCADFEFRGA